MTLQRGGFFGKTFSKTLSSVFGKSMKTAFSGLTSKSLGKISNSMTGEKVEKWPICNANKRPLLPGGPDGCGKDESPQPTKEQLKRGWAYGNHPGNISNI